MLQYRHIRVGVEGLELARLYIDGDQTSAELYE